MAIIINFIGCDNDFNQSAVCQVAGFFQNLADLHLKIVSFVENTVVKTHINENLHHSV